MSSSTEAAGPLDGVRVLDFSMYLAGPYASRLLADHGASVIKVEPPTGDPIRTAQPKVDEVGRYFAQMNCGKKCIVLDLKTEDGMAAAKRLIAESDVLLENFRPGVMTRIGLDDEAIRRVRPDIINCSVSGYGQTGRDSSRAAYAPVVHASSGYDMAAFEYARVSDRPARNRSTAADILAATHAFGAICAALLRRERTGEGERIDVTLQGSMLNLLPYEVQAAQVSEETAPIVFAPIKAADGFLMVVPVSQLNFQALARGTGKLEWLEDPRFCEYEARWLNWDTMLEELEIWAAGHTAEEAEAMLLEAGCPCTRYRTIDDVIADPELKAQGGAVELRDAAGAYLVTNSPMRFSQAPVGARPWVARLGEHQDEILKS